jgi:hypothetical protein
MKTIATLPVLCRGTWAFYRLVPEAVQELRRTLGG